MSLPKKRRSPGRRTKTSSRSQAGEAIDQLVLIVAGILLLFWVVGYAYLWAFPNADGGSGGLADSSSNSTNLDSDSTADTALNENNDNPGGSGSDDGSGSSDADGSSDNDSNSFDGNTDGNLAQDDRADQNKQAKSHFSSNGASSAADANAIKKQLASIHEKEIKRLTSEHKKDVSKQLSDAMKGFQKQSEAQMKGIRSQLDEKSKQYNDLIGENAKLKRELAAAKRASTQMANQVARTGGGSKASMNPPRATSSTTNSGSNVNSSAKSKYTTHPFRFWKSNKGSDAWLAFVRWENEEIVLVDANDDLFKIPLDRLSDADQRYVKRLK